MQNDVFTNYRIESNSNNEISLELTTQALYIALKSGVATATDVVLRLAKKGKQPVLSLAIKNTVSQARSCLRQDQLTLCQWRRASMGRSTR